MINPINWQYINLLEAAIESTQEDNEIVASSTGKRIVVMQMLLVASNQTIIRFESGIGGSALTGPISLYSKQGGTLDPGASNGIIALPFSLGGWFRTGIGELLNLERSGGEVNGCISYVLV